MSTCSVSLGKENIDLLRPQDIRVEQHMGLEVFDKSAFTYSWDTCVESPIPLTTTLHNRVARLRISTFEQCRGTQMLFPRGLERQLRWALADCIRYVAILVMYLTCCREEDMYSPSRFNLFHQKLS